MVSHNLSKTFSHNLSKTFKAASNVAPKLFSTTLKPLIPTTLQNIIRSHLQPNTISNLFNNVESNLNKGYLKFSQQANTAVSPLSEPSKGKIIIDLFTKGPLGSLESNGATITKYLTDIKAPALFVTNIGTIANALRWISSVYLLIELLNQKKDGTDDKIIDETIKTLNESSNAIGIPKITIQRDYSIQILENKINEMNAFIMEETEKIPDIDLIHILVKLLEKKDEIIEKMEEELNNNQERIIDLDMKLCQCENPNNDKQCESSMEQVDGGGYFSKRRKSHKRRKNKKKRTRRKSLKKLF
jgi:hypothetical protein